MGVLKALEPAKVFHFFEEICGIPPGSYTTKAISDYLAAFARERGLKYIQDEVNNVVIFGDASAGYEDAPAVMPVSHTHLDVYKRQALFCNVKKDCVIENMTLPILYQAPLMLEQSNLSWIVCRELGINAGPCLSLIHI